MTERPSREDLKRRIASLRARSEDAGAASDRLAAWSAAATRRLAEATRHAPSPPSAPMLRRHVVVVSGDPAFLDAARVLLQAGRYNVTTTNLLPRSYELIEAAGAAVLVVDLTIEEPAVWALVERLGAGERTRHLPIVFTATAPALLERADRQAWPAGGRFVFVKPFRPAACPPARRRAYPVGAARSSGAASRCFDAPG